MATRAATRRNDKGSSAKAETPQRILDVAEALVQVRGFNAFSYGDVAAELGITTASMHYHFAAKADLGGALIARYSERFTASLAAIDAGEGSPRQKLEAYAGLYADVFRANRMCLCGMLAAEFQTLPGHVTEAIIGFFDDNEAWLAEVLEAGRRERTLRFEGSARDTARVLIGGLEGAMLLARPYGDIERFQAASTQLISGLAAD